MNNRKLLYIYYYVNGRKVRNVGFVECKEKDTTCKFNLTLKYQRDILQSLLIFTYTVMEVRRDTKLVP